MAVAAAFSSSSPLVLHRIFRPPPLPVSSPSLLSFLFFKPLQSTPLSSFPSLSPSPRPLLILFHSLSSPSLSSSPHSRSLFYCNRSDVQTPIQDETDYDIDDDDDDEFESGSEKSGKQTVAEVSERLLNSSVSLKLPSLTVKEKKELASYAHSLGKKLKSQRVGKSGVTDSVATALIETLESNELLKLKIHGTCPGELDDVVKQLEEATGSVVVGQIGRTVILYRPSLTKLKAEEKKKQAQRDFMKKRQALKPFLQNKGKVVRLSGRGRRGSSRILS